MGISLSYRPGAILAISLVLAAALALVMPRLAPGQHIGPVPVNATSPQTMFLEVVGLAGEATNVRFAETIEVDAFKWGASNPDGKSPVFSSFTVEKRLDRASPSLLEYVGLGTVISSARLHVIKAGGDQQEYLRYCFTGVQVADYQTTATGGSDFVSESLSLAYVTVVERYQRQNPDGTLAAPIFGGWNTQKRQTVPPGDC